MEVGMIGLGRMGASMTRRLLKAGCRVAAHDQDAGQVEASTHAGAVGAKTLAEVVAALRVPRIMWIMVPAGEATERVLTTLAPLLAQGDVVVDGGNSFYKDSIRRAAALASQGIDLMDVGTSGGIWGAETGYCLMAGGSAQGFARLEPVLKVLAPADGYRYMGPSGAGHFAKMVHNGIEYGLMQAYAEGFALLHQSPYAFDLAAVAGLWNRGSIVRSWLLELTERAFSRDSDLAALQGYVEDSGEGRWTVQEAVALGVPVPVIASALFARFASRNTDVLSHKVIAALRREFGGHAVHPQ